MIYLTHYEEYPIYEPAEGGYYYAGQQPCEFYRLNSIKQAKRKLAKMRKELENEGFVVDVNNLYVNRYSKYIGGGESWYIEKSYGQNRSGWHPYE